MHWDDLQLLNAAARAGTLAGLARILGIDPTTASRRMRQVEDRLGLALFERSRGRLQLTPQAEALCLGTEAMADAAAEVLQTAQRLRDAPEGTVVVSAPPTLARHVLAPAVARQAAQTPGVTVDLQVDASNVRVDRLEADIAVRLGSNAGAQGSLLSRVAGQLSYAVFVAVDGDPDGWIAYPEAFGHVPEAAWVEHQLAGNAPVMRSDDPAVMAAAVASGAGKALLAVPAGRGVSGIVQSGDIVIEKDVIVLRRPDGGGRSAVGLVHGWILDALRNGLQRD